MAGLALATASVSSAQTLKGPGASGAAPGQMMQDKGSVKGTSGASGYAPGHKMQAKGSVKGEPGASGYAPGHKMTTGAIDKTRKQ